MKTFSVKIGKTGPLTQAGQLIVLFHKKEPKDIKKMVVYQFGFNPRAVRNR